MSTYEMEPIKTNADRAGEEFTRFIAEWMKKWEDKLDFDTDILIKITDKVDGSTCLVNIKDLKDRVAEKKSRETMTYMPKHARRILRSWFK